MKTKLKIFTLCFAVVVALTVSNKSYALIPVTDLSVKAALDLLQGTTIMNEVSRVIDAGKQLNEMIVQIERLDKLHSDAMQQYDELMEMTDWQGTWEELGGMKMEMPGSLKETLEMYKFNKKTIENVMLDNPVENVLNKVEGFEDYIPDIDTEYWTEKTDVDFKQMFRADAVALMMKKDYDDWREFLYADETGEIPKLMDQWQKYHDSEYVTIKDKAEKEKAQAYLYSLTEKMKSLKYEEQLKKDRYEAALAFCGHVKEIRSKVADVRAMYREAALNSKIGSHGKGELEDKLRKEEEAVLSNY